MKILSGLFRIESAAKPLACAAALALSGGSAFADNLASIEVGGALRLEVVRDDAGLSVLSAYDPASGLLSTINLPVAIDSVNLIRFTEDGATVVGEAGRDVEAVFAYDAQAQNLKDSFLASRVSLSPSGRYAAFKRFRPRFDHSAEMAGDVTVVYDFEASASANRLAPEAASGPLAGLPVHPADNLASGSHYSDAEGQSDLRSDYYWLNDSKFVFVELREGIHSLVTVDLSAGAENAVLSERVLPVENWIKRDATEDEAARAMRAFAVTGFESDGASLKLEFVELEWLRSRSAEISLAE